MAVQPGTRFGSYEVVEPIGAGGMGEVYRAHDTTLARDVAIKVLPASFAEDAGRVERFEREAKTLAALNHPNIAQIYGLEKSGGTTALVMELVDGATLAERIAKGPIPADEALNIALQIADALEAAHGQSIVHRDLKPANIKLRRDGTVKVLDFGIAKALAPENLVSGPQSPIMTTPATQVGVILGTAAYMSPEQAKGKAVDQRTDIWAFGCVLYEMLTGQLAFGAEDVPTTLARVIANDTNLNSLPAAIPAAVRHTVKLCLQKDPRNRLHAMGDVRLALEGKLESLPADVQQAADGGKSSWRRAGALAMAVVVTAIVVGSAVWFAMQPVPATVTRFVYDFPEGQAPRQTGWPFMTVSPDGRYFIYSTRDGLYLRAMDELEARLIPGTEHQLDSIAISPDGRTSVFWGEGGRLERLAVSGGASLSLADIGDVYGISWQQDGTILYGQEDGIYRISANGGTPERVIPIEGMRHHGAELLPDGDSVLFSESPSPDWDAGQIIVQSISTGERKVLGQGGSDARYVPTGHIVYALGDTLYAIAFDADTLSTSGGPVPLIQGVLRSTGSQTGAAHFSISDTGTLVYVTGGVSPVARTLVWVDRDGREEAIAAPPRTYTSPQISPDGTKIAVNARDQELDIWTWDLNRENLTRLTFGAGQDRFPLWSPDGVHIAYHSQPDDGNGLFWSAADGTGPAERLADGVQIFPSSFVPDGSGILAYGDSTGSNTNDDIVLVRLDESREVVPLLHTTFGEVMPNVSPDGRWLAYSSNESGNFEVYVRSFPNVDSGGRWQVSTDGGDQPLWSRDGRELFYRNGDAMMVVPVETDPTFVPGRPQILFTGDFAAAPGGRTYDVSADGQRFLMLKESRETSSTAKIIVVESWFEELKRLVPRE